MSNQSDRPRSAINDSADQFAGGNRGGAGNRAAQVYRRAHAGEPALEASGALPFMDVMLQGEHVQRREQVGGAPLDLAGSEALSVAERGTSGPTSSLPHAGKMHAAFDGVVDFSQVNVHRGPDAAQASAQLGAQAYAVGSSIALPKGADEFTTAHELAHVAQKQTGKVQPRGVSSPGDSDEQQADAVAARVVAGEPIGPALAAPSLAAAPVQRRGVSEDDLHGPAAAGVGQVTQAGVATGATSAIERARASMDALLRDARSKRRPLNTLLAEALGIVPSVHIQIGILASQPEGSFPRENGLRHLDGLYAAAWQLHDLADGLQPYPIAAELLWQAMSGVADSGQMIRWTPPASSSEVSRRQRAETACEPGSEDDHTRRPACTLEKDARGDLREQARIGLLFASEIFFGECNKKAEALTAAISRDQAIWGAIAGAAANTILAVLSGGVALAGTGMAPAGSAVGVGAAAGAGGFTEGRAVGIAVADAARASVPVASSEFGIAIRDMGNKVVADIGKEAMRNRTRETARTSPGGRSGDERQQTIDALGVLSNAFRTRLAHVAATMTSLTDEQLIELKNALLDTTTMQQSSAQFVASFVADFRSELEPIGTRDHGSGLGAPPERMLPGVVHHRAVFVEGVGGKTRLALVRHVTDTFPAIRQVGRAAADSIARGADEVTEGDTYDEQAWKNYRDDPGDEFHFERWIKNEHLQVIAGRGAPTIPASRVQGLSFADMLGAE